MTDDFMSLTLDVWSIPAESARRVGHPAPFPVELPEQLVRLYTYKHDLVLDPFMGSGSALAAAARLERRYVGYDLDPAYVEIARRRVAEVLADPHPDDDVAIGAMQEGRSAPKLAADVLVDAGFVVTARSHRVPKTGVTVSLVATDADGATWWFDVGGSFTSHRGGLQRTEAVWRWLGRAHALRGRNGAGAGAHAPLVLLTTRLPKRPGEGDATLRAAGPDAFFDAVDVLTDHGRGRLALYAKGGYTNDPQPGFWSPEDLVRRRI
jgi:hypothetical protein